MAIDTDKFESLLVDSMRRIGYAAIEMDRRHLARAGSALPSVTSGPRRRWSIPLTVAVGVVAVVLLTTVGTFLLSGEDGGSTIKRPAFAGPGTCVQVQPSATGLPDDRDSRVAAQRVHDSLDASFGTPDKGDSSATLRRGLVGVGIEQGTDALVVRVDPALVDIDGLRTELTTETIGSALEVKVIESCYSAADLERAESSIASSGLLGSYELSPYTSRWLVHLPPAMSEIGDRLEKDLGTLVEIRYSKNAGARQ